MFVPGSGWPSRDVARSALEEVFTLGKRGKETPRLPRVKTSSRADLATSRSCHPDPGTNIQTTSFGPSLDELSNCFPVETPRYVSYSTMPLKRYCRYDTTDRVRDTMLLVQKISAGRNALHCAAVRPNFLTVNVCTCVYSFSRRILIN